MTTGIQDAEWLDSKVVELSAENKRLRAALEEITHGPTSGRAENSALDLARDVIGTSQAIARRALAEDA